MIYWVAPESRFLKFTIFLSMKSSAFWRKPLNGLLVELLVGGLLTMAFKGASVELGGASMSVEMTLDTTGFSDDGNFSLGSEGEVVGDRMMLSLDIRMGLSDDPSEKSLSMSVNSNRGDGVVLVVP